MKKLQTSSKPEKKSDMLGVILAIDKPCEKIILK